MAEQTSQFNEASDNAALKIKGELNALFGKQLESRKVAVGSNGQPLPPPPPPGSYARAAFDQAQQQRQSAAPQQPIGTQAPAGTPEQQSDGSVAPPLTGRGQEAVAPEVPSQSSPPPSEKANARIQQLIAAMHEKDRQIAELAASKRELEDVRRQVDSLQQERDKFVREHLDNLDPEQRAAVLAEARFREMLEHNNRQLLQQLQPQLADLQAGRQQSEFERLARKYPGFDMQIHPPLIDQLRAKYPGLTVELAFKAVAEGDEAIPREVAAQTAVPPVVPANRNGAQLPRYMPEPEADPVRELHDFQVRVNELLRSSDPLKQREGLRMQDRLLSARLHGANYKGKPSVFN